MTYATSQMQALYVRARDGDPSLHLELGGIVGDDNHKFGYHIGRDLLPSSDYSVRLPNDRLGSPDAASAIDLTPPSQEGMRTLTQRLVNAWRAHDPRMACVREFAGTLDNHTVYAIDIPTGNQTGSQWPISHTTHVHISIYRAFTQNAGMLNALADVCAGKPLHAPGGGGGTPPPPQVTEDDEMFIAVELGVSGGTHLLCVGDHVYPMNGTDEAQLVHYGVKQLPVPHSTFADLSARSHPVNQERYTLFIIPPGFENAGYVYRVRAGEPPKHVRDPAELATLVRFNLVANPHSPYYIISQKEIDALTAVYREGA